MIVNILNNQDRNLRGNSKTWANRMSKLAPNTCPPCAKQHGKIVDVLFLKYQPRVQDHPYCQCVYVPMRTKAVGTVTNQGADGADVYLTYFGRLPSYYIDKQTAYDKGWKSDKSKNTISSLFPGKMIGGDVYDNDDCKLPYVSGRVWYEADINYVGGIRNRSRILYSNDGLMFVTYDHYHTFYEVTQ